MNTTIIANPSLWVIALAAQWLLLTTAIAQNIGGNSTTIYQADSKAPHGRFGHSVGNAGDVNKDGYADLIVGAPGTRSGNINPVGSAFVFSGADSSILFRWDGTQDWENFGWFVAGGRDFNQDEYPDLIVTSRYGRDNHGSVQIFSGLDGSQIFRWSGDSGNDLFGNSVSDAGDVDGDGFHDIIIGAPYADPGGRRDAGSAYVYSGENGTLIHQWNGITYEDRMGNSVSGIGDINRDGFDDLIVGSPGKHYPHSSSPPGKVFIYSGNDGSVLFQLGGEEYGDKFGESLSKMGDLNGDRIQEFIVGAPFASLGNRRRAGSVYFYSGASGSLLRKWDADAPYYNFGWRVSNAGDIDGKGIGDLLIGAFKTSPLGNPEANSAFAYSGLDGGLIHRWDGEAVDDEFASCMSSAGDVTGNGRDEVIFGSPGASPGGSIYAGSATVFGFNPFIQSNTSTISATTGGTLNLDLDFPDAAGGNRYRVLISASGTGPTHYGVPIPLSQDSLLTSTYFGRYPFPTHTSLQGLLDSNGDASASIFASTWIPSALIGSTYFLAAIANQIGNLPEYSSISIPLTITP
jgi:hypothetical protein